MEEFFSVLPALQVVGCLHLTPFTSKHANLLPFPKGCHTVSSRRERERERERASERRGERKNERESARERERERETARRAMPTGWRSDPWARRFGAARTRARAAPFLRGCHKNTFSLFLLLIVSLCSLFFCVSPFFCFLPR